MIPKNEPGQPADTFSTRECAAFDPKAGKWQPLPDLPAGRSSHDVVVVNDTLVVVGGWDQKGKGEKPTWHDTTLTLDLKAKDARWQSVPQPFKRRALTAAAVGTKVYVIAGLGAEKTDRQVDILDVATGKWATGPKLPGDDRVAFSPAATVVDNRLVVNTNAGPVYRLNDAADGWEQVGDAAASRHVARLVPHGKEHVVLIGGAGGGGNVAEVEVIRLAAKGEPVKDEK
jgi:N-acetylneuraminic acid mutarotase